MMSTPLCLSSPMSHSFELREGAFIISDAHYSAHHRPELKTFLQDILSGKFQPTQLILMGDIFDILFSPISHSLHVNKDMIELLDEIASKMEVIYLEGNHDFCLEGIFKNIKTVPLQQQPLTCKYKNKRVLLAHGDFSEGFTYKVYTALIRSRFLLTLLGFIDSVGNHFILQKLDRYLEKKEDCNGFRGFETYVKNRLSQRFNDRCDYFFEGHFHQNKSFQIENFTYINLPAFACNQRYFIVQSSAEELLNVDASKGLGL